MSSAKLKTNGKWLVWAREMSNFKRKDIAKKMGVDSEEIRQWEQTGDIGQNELKKLADYYRRPPMMFFNNNSPSYNEDKIVDFRTKGSKQKKKVSPQILRELESAQNKRENLILLEEESEEEIIPNFTLSMKNEVSDVKIISEYIREKINMTKPQIDVLNNSENALNHWINKVEGLGVLVFQFYDIEPKDMRGYAIYNEKLPIIGINKKEHVNGRKFTLFHELAHLIINNEGIIISNFNKFAINYNTEELCNKIAAEILVPRETFEIKINDYDNNNEWKDNQIKSLSKYFKVSNEVILRRLLTLDKISNDFYKSKKHEWEKNYFAFKNRSSNKKNKNSKKNTKPKIAKEKTPNNTKNIRKATEALRKNGELYTKMVLEAYDSQLITNSTMADYLGVSLQVIVEIRKKLSKELFE